MSQVMIRKSGLGERLISTLLERLLECTVCQLRHAKKGWSS